MHEGTGPYVPGVSVGDPEGTTAQALGSVRARPALRLIHSPVTRTKTSPSRVIRLDVERALRHRMNGTFTSVAIACAAGVAAGLFWCASLALLAFKSRSSLGDVGAFLLAAGVQLAAIGVCTAYARSRSLARTFGVREGTHR